MNDFCEAVLTLEVNADVAEVYKTAIEKENTDTRWRRNNITDSEGNIKSNNLEPVWNGVYAYADVGIKNQKYGDNDLVVTGDVQLTIQLLSHTAKDLKQVVDWYERVGCTVVRVDYKGAKS